MLGFSGHFRGIRPVTYDRPWKELFERESRNEEMC